MGKSAYEKAAAIAKSARTGYNNLQKNPDRVNKHLDAIGRHAAGTAKNAGIAATRLQSGDVMGAAKYGARSVKSAARAHHSAKGLYHLSKTKHANSVQASDAGAADDDEN